MNQALGLAVLLCQLSEAITLAHLSWAVVDGKHELMKHASAPSRLRETPNTVLVIVCLVFDSVAKHWNIKFLIRPHKINY